MRDIVILTLIAVFFLLSLKSRKAGMYTYWWFAIFRPQDWMWSDYSSLRLPLLAALVFAIPSLISGYRPRFDHPIAKLMLVFWLLLLTANFLAGCGDIPIIRTADMVDLFILFMMVLLSVDIIRDKKTFFWLVFIIALSLGFYSGKGGISAAISGSSFYGRDQMGGFMSGSNAYALATAMMTLLIFTVVRWFQKNQLPTLGLPSKIESLAPYFRWLFLLLFAGSIYNVIALQSRGSFLALMAGILIYMLLHQSRLKLLLGSALLVSVILIVVPLPEGFSERIDSAFNDSDERDVSAASRPHFWGVAVKMAENYPLGVGPGCYPAYYLRFDSSGGEFGLYRSVHSSHFQVLADAGYIGVLVWVLLFLYYFRSLFKVRAQALKLSGKTGETFYLNISNALIASGIIFVLGGAFYEVAYFDLLWLYFGLTIVLVRLIPKDVSLRAKQE